MAIYFPSVVSAHVGDGKVVAERSILRKMESCRTTISWRVDLKHKVNLRTLHVSAPNALLLLDRFANSWPTGDSLIWENDYLSLTPLIDCE